MPYFPHTPESLLPRSDSKNAGTTCRGITSNGRPCRRALASPKSSSIGRRGSSKSAFDGIVAVLQNGDLVQATDLYCWQHKDQAEQSAQAAPDKAAENPTDLSPLQERSSIDTLVQKLGITAIDSHSCSQPPRHRPRRDAQPVPPAKTETRDFVDKDRPHQASHARRKQHEHHCRRGEEQSLIKQRPSSFWSSLCCTRQADEDDDYVEIVRHSQRSQDSRPPEMVEARSSRTKRSATAAIPAREPVDVLPARPQPQQRVSSNSQTTQLLALIPPQLPPTTASALLAELIKPKSPADEEGYIYIFWLTPQNNATPLAETARSLLSPSRPHSSRRISDVMTEYSHDGSDGATASKNAIMLKIGHASNVTRRMNEWQRQCGYALNLVRWYPYVPSSATPSPQPSPIRKPNRQRPQPELYPDLSRPLAEWRQSGLVRKVPCVKRVERLVHLELAARQVKRQCGVCGKEHREWFEIEASQAGVKAVDEVVRRWVGWAERQTR